MVCKDDNEENLKKLIQKQEKEVGKIVEAYLHTIIRDAYQQGVKDGKRRARMEDR